MIKNNISLENYLDLISNFDSVTNFDINIDINIDIDFVSDYRNKKIPQKFLYTWKFFNYPSADIFKNDLEFLLQNIYTDLKIIGDSPVRLSQMEFKNKLKILYGNKCVISGNDCLDELEASHIVEVKNGGDSDVSNGLLLEANLHKTFDKYSWAINPDTCIIESSHNNTTSIRKYTGNKIDIKMNPFLYTNLKKRYDIFIEYNNGI